MYLPVVSYLIFLEVCLIFLEGFKIFLEVSQIFLEYNSPFPWNNLLVLV